MKVLVTGGAGFIGSHVIDGLRDAGARVLCVDSLDTGVPGLHFYTFNTSSATREIYAALGLGPNAATS